MDNIFELIPKDLGAEIFESIVESNQIKIERIVSKGHSSPASGWYDQSHNEWVIVLRGKATLLFEDSTSVTLTSGDYVNIERHRKHKVHWTDPDIETIWLAVHY